MEAMLLSIWRDGDFLYGRRASFFVYAGKFIAVWKVFCVVGVILFYFIDGWSIEDTFDWWREENGANTSDKSGSFASS